MNATPLGICSPRTRARGRRLAAGAPLFVLLAACNELEVFPAEIQIPQSAAGSSTTFEAYARLRKVRRGDILNDPITWDAPTGVSATVVSGVSGRSAHITVPTGSLDEFTIEVSAKGKRDRLVVRVVAASGGDHALATPHIVPSVAAIFENGASCPPDSTYAFVDRARLGDRQDTCSSRRVIVFATTRPPMDWTDPTWTNSDDEIDARSGVLQVVPVRVYNLSVATARVTAATDRMKELLTMASGLFANNRVGLNFAWDLVVNPLPSPDRTCHEIHALINPYNAAEPDATMWTRDAINVYWVGFDATDSRAKHCWGPAELWPKNVIRVEMTEDVLSHSLAHELGHVLGQYVPWGLSNQHMGHVDEFKGFAKDNLMYGNVNFGTTAARTRLSLGQVFRMHFDPRSWLAPALTTNECGCDPYASICSRLSRDTRLIKKDKGKLDAESQQCSPP